MPTPPPSPEKTSQLQERLRYYENEISDMSKELEQKLKNNNSELRNAQFEVEQEKAATLLMKEEGNEKNKMLQNALETNVKSISYFGIIMSFYIL